MCYFARMWNTGTFRACPKRVFFLLCIQTDADFWDVQCHNTDLSRDMRHTSHGKGIPE